MHWFVLNVLVVEPSEDDEEVVVDENAPEAVKLLLRKKAEESIDEQYAVGWHRDATLGLAYLGADADHAARAPRLRAVRGGAGGDGRRAVSAECGSAALAVRARRADREVAPKQKSTTFSAATRSATTGHERDQGGRVLSQGPPRVPRARAVQGASRSAGIYDALRDRRSGFQQLLSSTAVALQCAAIRTLMLCCK